MTRIHTEEQGLRALEALGYNPSEDRIMSALITVDTISVRRLEFEGGRAIVVEDKTWIKPRNLTDQEHPVPTGSLETSPDAGQGG